MKKASVYYWDEKIAKNALFGKTPSVQKFLTNYRKLVDVPLAEVCDNADSKKTCAEKVYALMQGEKWSPLGEAKDLIQNKGLNHTSMSVGDIVEIEGDFYIARQIGFEEIWK